MFTVTPRRLPVTSAVLALLLFAALPVDAATLGRGMEQLVRLRETNNPKLAAALKLHLTNPSGAVLVQVRLEDPAKYAEVMAALVRAGFVLQAVSQLDPGLVEGYLPLSAARAAAGVPGVRRVLAVQRPHASAGQVQSQAVATQKAAAAHARGIDGTGARVGLLSDSFNFYGLVGAHPDAADDVATGDLPAQVTVLDDLSVTEGIAFGAGDEGRAMTQLVHDIAPGAALGFATAFKGPVSFSNNILDLRRRFHADVIVDDVGYSDEPFFSDGLIARAVSKVVSEGAAYFSSAGNNGLEAYESSYDAVTLAQARKLVASGKENLDLNTLAALGVPAKSFHNFRDADGSVSISQKFTSVFGVDFVSFQWDEPFDLGKVKTDYNMYVFDAAGHYLDPNDPTTPIFFTQDDNTDTDEPAELVAFLAPGDYQIVIGKVNDGGARRIKYIDVNGLGESARQNAPSIFGHAAARGSMAVAARFYGIPGFPEDFSSPGPVTILFDEHGRRLRDPEIRAVPQITGVDGVDTTFFGFDLEGNGLPNFFGTSAAAPNVAGVAALVVQAMGGSHETSPDEIYERLLRTATPMPLAEHRTLAGSLAGPVAAAANGDYPGADHYWSVAVLPLTHQTVKRVTIDLTKPDMFFVSPADPDFGFKVNATHGIGPSDVTATRSADGASLTLTFTAGKFGAGDFLTFSLVAVPNALPLLSEVDADRVEGGTLTVVMSDGSTKSGAFFVDRKLPVNAFTGAGLVNADAATRRR
jgi:Subtilase family